MVAIENPKFNGAELVAELAKTGTGDRHLKPARDLLAFVHRKENRVATASEVIDALESAGVTDAMLKYPRTPALTVQKARALAEAGRWDAPAAAEEPTVEERILAGQKLPEEPAKTAVEEMAEASGQWGDGDEKSPLSLRPVKKPGRPKSDRPRHETVNA